MKRDLQKQTDHLMDAIGGIDDLFLNEAMNWQEHSVRAGQTYSAPKRIQRKSPIRALLIAASLALVLVIGMSAMVTSYLRSGTQTKVPNNGVDPSPKSEYDNGLDVLLSECLQSSSFTVCSTEEVPYFDETVRIAVEDRSTGELFVSRPLSASEQQAVQRELRAVGASVDVNTAPVAESAYSVWVTLGDGTVLTPCLHPSYGNLGAGILFDYESERVPTQIFMDLLSALRERQLR